jgi:hypothetical protein
MNKRILKFGALFLVFLMLVFSSCDSLLDSKVAPGFTASLKWVDMGLLGTKLVDANGEPIIIDDKPVIIDKEGNDHFSKAGKEFDAVGLSATGLGDMSGVTSDSRLVFYVKVPGLHAHADKLDENGLDAKGENGKFRNFDSIAFNVRRGGSIPDWKDEWNEPEEIDSKYFYNFSAKATYIQYSIPFWDENGWIGDTNYSVQVNFLKEKKPVKIVSFNIDLSRIKKAAEDAVVSGDNLTAGVLQAFKKDFVEDLRGNSNIQNIWLDTEISAWGQTDAKYTFEAAPGTITLKDSYADEVTLVLNAPALSADFTLADNKITIADDAVGKTASIGFTATYGEDYTVTGTLEITAIAKDAAAAAVVLALFKSEFETELRSKGKAWPDKGISEWGTDAKYSLEAASSSTITLKDKFMFESVTIVWTAPILGGFTWTERTLTLTTGTTGTATLHFAATLVADKFPEIEGRELKLEGDLVVIVPPVTP